MTEEQKVFKECLEEAADLAIEDQVNYIKKAELKQRLIDIRNGGDITPLLEDLSEKTNMNELFERQLKEFKEKFDSLGDIYATTTNSEPCIMGTIKDGVDFLKNCQQEWQEQSIRIGDVSEWIKVGQERGYFDYILPECLQNILLQVQDGLISTGRAIELIKDKIKL